MNKLNTQTLHSCRRFFVQIRTLFESKSNWKIENRKRIKKGKGNLTCIVGRVPQPAPPRSLFLFYWPLTRGPHSVASPSRTGMGSRSRCQMGLGCQRLLL
jgi:hypothetical protein